VIDPSKSVEWWSPAALFQTLDREFGFTLDAAATPENALCKRFMSRHLAPGTYPTPRIGGEGDCVGDDGLCHRWSGEKVWCNPPYGGQEGDWVLKTYREVHLYPDTADLAVMLLPVKTDRAWFLSCIWDNDIHATRRGVEVRFIQGRLKFGGPHASGSAAFESMVVIFRPVGDAGA
jgi:site-specific DNA-methyltransferase (adenine-specific)